MLLVAFQLSTIDRNSLIFLSPSLPVLTAKFSLTNVCHMSKVEAESFRSQNECVRWWCLGSASNNLQVRF